MGGASGPARIYPKADAKTQWWETAFARGTFTGIEKILLHTTETTGWPGYASGSMAPTLTYHPRLRAWRQHNYLDRSARALVDPTSTPVRENRDNVIQIEIVAYADEATGRRVGGLPVSQLTDAQLGDLADFIKFVRSQYGGPPLLAAKFLPYPQSYGNSPVRMTSSQYDAFKGVLGHQHASGNDHGDPGAIDVARILTLAGATTPTTPIKEDDMPTPAELWGYPTNITDADGKKIDALQVLADARSYGALGNAKADALASSLGQVLAKVLDLPAEVGAELEQTLKDAVVNVEVNFPPTPPAPAAP